MQALTLTLSLPPVIDKISGSLSKDDDDGNGNNEARNKWSHWLNEEIIVLHVRHTGLVYFCDVVCQMTTSNFQMLNFNDNMNII